jgi:peptidoglycan hydrolase-like protein with peptidoglycan-binding domain
MDLVALGYNPGSIQGDLTPETADAISKFQTDNNLQVTGAASPLVAAIISAKVDEMRNPAAEAPARGVGQTTAVGGSTATPSAPGDCEPTVADAAEDTRKTAGAVGRLASALGRFGGNRATDAVRDAADATSAAAGVATAAGDLAGSKPGC